MKGKILLPLGSIYGHVLPFLDSDRRDDCFVLAWCLLNEIVILSLLNLLSVSSSPYSEEAAHPATSSVSADSGHSQQSD